MVCGVCMIVLAFSLWQVRVGHWEHVDASVKAERSSLNIFLTAILFFSAAVAFYQMSAPGLPLGLFLSGVLMVVVMLVSPWLKLSLHASFAAFAVLLLWPLKPWHIALASAAAAAICWSRVVLRRHTVVEVLAGSFLGAFLGACFWLVLRTHA